MQSEQTSKRWADYSEDSEEQYQEDQDATKEHKHGHHHHKNEISTKKHIDHRSEEFISDQLKRLEDAGRKNEYVWVLLECKEQNLLDKKVKEIRNLQQGILAFPNRQNKQSWDIKANASDIKKWIVEGLDQDKKIIVSISERNFIKNNKNYERNKQSNGGPRERGRGRGRGGRGRGGRREGQHDNREERGERRERRNRDDNQNPQQKKKYVDKVTGLAPTNKIEVQQKIIELKQRHYTREQAEKVGLQLGNFRNKKKEQNSQKIDVKTFEMKQQRQVKGMNERQEIKKVIKQESKWLRKGRQEPKEEENVKEGKEKNENAFEDNENTSNTDKRVQKKLNNYREKDNQQKQIDPRKKKYVKKQQQAGRDNILKHDNKSSHLLSEDSN